MGRMTSPKTRSKLLQLFYTYIWFDLKSSDFFKDLKVKNKSLMNYIIFQKVPCENVYFSSLHWWVICLQVTLQPVHVGPQGPEGGWTPRTGAQGESHSVGGGAQTLVPWENSQHWAVSPAPLQVLLVWNFMCLWQSISVRISSLEGMLQVLQSFLSGQFFKY